MPKFTKVQYYDDFVPEGYPWKYPTKILATPVVIHEYFIV